MNASTAEEQEAVATPLPPLPPVPAPPPKRTWQQRLRLPLMLLGPSSSLSSPRTSILPAAATSRPTTPTCRRRASPSAPTSPAACSELDVHDNQPVHAGRRAVPPRRCAVPHRGRGGAGAARRGAAAGRIAEGDLPAAPGRARVGAGHARLSSSASSSGSSSCWRRVSLRRPRSTARRTRSTRRAAQLASAQQQISAVVASLGGNPDIAPDQHPPVQQAQALLDRAKLNLSYTVIARPSDGVVTRVEQLQVGTYISAVRAGVRAGLDARHLDRGQLQGRPAHAHAGRPAGDRQGRQLSGQDLRGARSRASARHRLAVLAAAAGERHRQLGQGRAAPAGAPRARRSVDPALSAARRPERRRRASTRSYQRHLFGVRPSGEPRPRAADERRPHADGRARRRGAAPRAHHRSR